MTAFCGSSFGSARILCRRGHAAVLTAIPLIGCAVAIVWGTESQPKQDGKEAVSEEIRTRRLVIIDENGNKHAALGIMKDGEVRLELRDKQSEVRTWLNPDVVAAPSLGVIGASEKPLIELGSEKGKLPVLVMRDAAGTRRIAGIVAPDGVASLLVSDRRGKTRCRVSVSDDGDPELVLSDTSGKPRAHVIVEKEHGTCSVNFSDAEGRVRLTLQVDEQGQPALVACDSKQRPIWSAPQGR